MHELSLVMGLLERVEETAREHGARAVNRVRVRVGAMSGVEAELLGFAFETARSGTLCERATLEVTSVPAEWRCRACDAVLDAQVDLRCRACGGAARLAAGGEITFESIELEVD